MENSIKKIGIFPVTKQSQQELANSIIIPVLDGDVNDRNGHDDEQCVI